MIRFYLYVMIKLYIGLHFNPLNNLLFSLGNKLSTPVLVRSQRYTLPCVATELFAALCYLIPGFFFAGKKSSPLSHAPWTRGAVMNWIFKTHPCAETSPPLNRIPGPWVKAPPVCPRRQNSTTVAWPPLRLQQTTTSRDLTKLEKVLMTNYAALLFLCPQCVKFPSEVINVDLRNPLGRPLKLCLSATLAKLNRPNYYNNNNNKLILPAYL